MSNDRFTLKPGGWYALAMFPGYIDEPYHSPIRVDAIDLDSTAATIRLKFLNLAYAAGVQDFEIVGRILGWGPEWLTFAPIDMPERLYVISGLTIRWMATHFPDIEPRGLFDSQGEPIDAGFIALG